MLTKGLSTNPTTGLIDWYPDVRYMLLIFSACRCLLSLERVNISSMHQDELLKGFLSESMYFVTWNNDMYVRNRNHRAVLSKQKERDSIVCWEFCF
jgi:hypothetical protein